MADTVPTIPIPSTETAPIPKPYSGFSPPPESFGAGVGEGLVRLGAGLERISEQADAMAAMEAETTYTKGISEQLHGRVDTNPDTGETTTTPGFADLRGHQALEASSDLSQALAQRRLEIADGLKNDRQRRLFLGRTQGDLISAQRAVEAHVGSQIRYLAEEGFKTRVESALDLATKSAVMRDETGPVGLQIASQQLESMGPWLEVEAERRGLRGDDASRFVQDGQGIVVKAVVQRLLEEPGYALDARAFLEAHRNEISEKDAYAFRAQLAAAGIRDRSRVETDRIWADTGGDPSAAMAKARAVRDTDLSDAVQRRIDQRVSEDRAARLAADSPREARLESTIYQRGGLDRTSPDYQALSDEGRARVDAKFFAYQRSLRAEGTADRRAQNDADRDAKAWFNGLPTPGPQGQDRLTLDVDHAPELAAASPRARDEIRRLQENERKAASRGLTPKLTEFESMVARQAQAMFPKNKAKQAQLRADMREWWTEQTGEEGKPPDMATVRKKMADTLMLGKETGGLLWSSEMYRFEAERRGLGFKPYGPEKQKYPPNRLQPSGQPAPAPVPAKVYRRVDPATGEARVWNGSAWMPEGAR